MSNPKLYGRLGTWADVNRRIQEAEQFATAGLAFKVTQASDAQTVRIEAGETGGKDVTIFEAINKGNNQWLCMYNPDYYPKPK